MTTPDPGAQSIPVTSADATVQHDRAVSEKQAARARYLRSRGLSADPAPKPTPAPKKRLVVKAPQQTGVNTSSTVRPSAEATKPGGETRTRPASAAAVPPGSDEVRMSRREYQAVINLIDQQPWSKSAKRGSVGLTKKRNPS